MDRERFEELVEEAIGSLPEEFLSKMDNIEILVEPAPTLAQLRRARVRSGHTLLGLYEGVPQTRRGNYSMVLPDKITIFQKAIESRCRSNGEVRAEIRRVVLHEIAHHFGIGDGRLRELGY
jgi:predicted Zn-dependent protease with MMP-like domain